MSKLLYLTSIISPTAFVALLFPHLQSIDLCDRMPGPRQRPLASGSALPRISISPRPQHRLFGANVRLAALLGYGSEFATPAGNGHFGAALPAYGQLSTA
jgi:hypothetical protein